jgi:hypothetical protein
LVLGRVHFRKLTLSLFFNIYSAFSVPHHHTKFPAFNREQVQNPSYFTSVISSHTAMARNRRNNRRINRRINLGERWMIPPRSHRADDGSTILTTYSAETGYLTMHTRERRQVRVPLGNVLRLSENERRQHQSFETAIEIPYEYTENGEPMLPILCRRYDNGNLIMQRVDIEYKAVGVWDEDKQEWYFGDPNRPAFYFIVKHVPGGVEEDLENLQV